MSVEIYLDDVLVRRVDDVVRDEHIRPISVSVNGGNVLMIKVIEKLSLLMMQESPRSPAII